MGRDVWIRAKTDKRDYKGATGVCSGLFNITMADNGMVELGYLRKPYDQYDLLCDATVSAKDETGHIRILPDEVDYILDKSKEILATHTFDEDGYDVSEDYEGNFGTWQSKIKWEEMVEFFTEAKKLLEEDPNAEIYFCMWN